MLNIMRMFFHHVKLTIPSWRTQLYPCPCHQLWERRASATSNGIIIITVYERDCLGWPESSWFLSQLKEHFIDFLAEVFILSVSNAIVAKTACSILMFLTGHFIKLHFKPS